jgi:multidrug efflux pump subunit AcrB
MDFRNISAWSIRNPMVPFILFLALTLAGIVSFMGMEVQDDPDIEFPVVIVVISQPGAAPSEIVTQISQKVESAVRSINGVQSIRSDSNEGSSQIIIEFPIGEDINAVVSEVKNAVDQIRGDLPDGILEPQIFKAQTSGNPIGYFSVETNDMTLEQLSWFVDDTIGKRLLSVSGMASVSRSGGVDREIRVVLNTAKMQSLGVTASQINGVLRQDNFNAAGGRAEIAGSRQSIRVIGNAKSAYELSQSQISIGGGRTIKLSDVADVTDGFGEQRSLTKQNGKQVVTFAITRAKGASDVSVFDGAKIEMDKIVKENPNIQIAPITNSVIYTKAQYKSSMAAMIEGALLAVVVVFLFLRDWRATIISAIAIPLSAIPTFWFIDLLGFTLNQMSLLALGLVAGVLVDDAIVEIENIVRHMRMGKSAYQASIDAADEIGLAVVATTLSIVAVFLPVGLMPGIAGQFFKNFGLTVVVSVLMSLAVARMVTPMIAAYFLKSHGTSDHGSAPWLGGYMKVLHWSLKHRWSMMFLGLLSLLYTGYLFISTPTQFFPDANRDSSSISFNAPPGTTLERSEQISMQIANLLRQQPEVDIILERIEEGSGNVTVTLKKDRVLTSQEFEKKLTPLFQQFPDVQISFRQNGPGGDDGGTGRALTVMLSGSDPELLEKTAATLVEQMKGIPDIQSPRMAASLQRPELLIKPRKDLAAQLGVTTIALSQAIRIATQGDIDQNSAKFSLSDRQIPIRVMLPNTSRRDIATISNLPVQTATGGSVPLGRVADISFGSGPTAIERYNQNGRVFIGADLSPNAAEGDAQKKIDNLPIMKNLPSGVSNAPFGENKWMQEFILNFAIALMSGTLLVFAVLLLLYKRLMSPMVNMGSLLLAPLGGLIALQIVGQPISMPVFIGILMLFGIVAKNSILLVDFAIEEMQRGVPKFEAIMEAGHKRAQPIVMTTVAMTAGMVPTALSLSGDGAWRAPMGTVVIGGLIVSTVLTLLIVPAGFSLASGVETRLGPWLRRKVLAYNPGDENGIAMPDAKPAAPNAAPTLPGGSGSISDGLQPAE